MVFTLAVNYYLFQFLGIFDNDGRVLKVDLAQGFSKLFIITLALSLDGSTVFGFGEDCARVGPVVSRNIECMAGPGILQFYKSPDVAGIEFGNPCPVLASSDVELLQTLLDPV